VRVQDGALRWHDAAVTPPARLDLSAIEATVTGAGWPLGGPLGLRVALRSPGGGHVQVAGRVGFEPFSAALQLTTRDADLGPYQPYLPTALRVAGSADLDLAVTLPVSPSEPGVTARGRLALSRLDVRDGERTVMRVERAVATGLDARWPRRVALEGLALQGPWILVERDETGALSLSPLLAPGAGAGVPSATASDRGGALALAVGRLVVDDGGARLVDRSLSPPFAVDLHRLVVRAQGLSTAPAPPAQLSLTGRLGQEADLTLRGTVGPIGGPVRVDVEGELREFAVPRVNPYLVHHAAWRVREGHLTTGFRCHIEGDTLEARTDIRLSQLQLARAGADDQVKTRIGLPLGLIVALMKDRRGDIRVSLPVGGRLSDPRFDFREAMWSAVRTVAARTITLPVSWIGRLHVGSDSRIQKIQVDPVRFEPGTATLAPEGQAQAARVAAFLQRVGDVRMALKPIISADDLAELRRQALEATIERLAREARVSPSTAVGRLFKQHFPDRKPPDGHDALLAALADSEPMGPDQVPTLARARVETLRAVLKQAGIDPGRAPDMKPVEASEAVGGTIELELIEPDGSQPRLRDYLRRLGGGLPATDRVPG
jgi:hypothetical protein